MDYFSFYYKYDNSWIFGAFQACFDTGGQRIKIEKKGELELAGKLVWRSICIGFA